MKRSDMVMEVPKSQSLTESLSLDSSRFSGLTSVWRMPTRRSTRRARKMFFPKFRTVGRSGSPLPAPYFDSASRTLHFMSSNATASRPRYSKPSKNARPMIQRRPSESNSAADFERNPMIRISLSRPFRVLSLERVNFTAYAMPLTRASLQRKTVEKTPSPSISSMTKRPPGPHASPGVASQRAPLSRSASSAAASLSTDSGASGSTGASCGTRLSGFRSLTCPPSSFTRHRPDSGISTSSTPPWPFSSTALLSPCSVTLRPAASVVVGLPSASGRTASLARPGTAPAPARGPSIAES
mmetsp:Transcript_17688/g.47202  ORF Transcript_17688/g.47202 Transcript_17688/m.47202 type:complete len:298 (-) Transcript_17688:395-1288(-)